MRYFIFTTPWSDIWIYRFEKNRLETLLNGGWCRMDVPNPEKFLKLEEHKEIPEAEVVLLFNL